MNKKKNYFTRSEKLKLTNNSFISKRKVKTLLQADRWLREKNLKARVRYHTYYKYIIAERKNIHPKTQSKQKQQVLLNHKKTLDEWNKELEDLFLAAEERGEKKMGDAKESGSEINYNKASNAVNLLNQLREAWKDGLLSNEEWEEFLKSYDSEFYSFSNKAVDWLIENVW